MKTLKIAMLCTAAVAMGGLTACNNMMPAKTMPAHTQPMAKMNVVQLAQSNPDFSILVEAVVAAGLADVLSDPNAHYTVFAPNNAAFANLLKETGMTKAQLLANKPMLQKVLSYHVVSSPMAMYAKDVKPGVVTAVSKDTFTVTPQMMIMDGKGRTAKLLKTDLAASNGVVHVIDKVLLP
jgi:uncharacterized surface protein with fasciclin (FAS1) repeats